MIKKGYMIFCEWDFGLEREVFDSIDDAINFALNENSFSKFLDENEFDIDYLIEEGLFGTYEVNVHGSLILPA